MKDNIALPLDTKLHHFLDQLPGYWACKNEESVYLYLNQGFQELFGAKKNSKMDLVGKTDFDIPCQVSNCADDFRKHDKLVYNSEKKLKIFEVHPYADNVWKAGIFTKIPLYENKKLVGTVLQGSDVTSSNSLELGMLLFKHTPSFKSSPQGLYTIEDESLKFKLSKRESECLFFLLRGKSAKHIARYLTISVRTVEQYLECLKLKFQVNNKNDLFEKAIEAGFLNSIPQSLFTTQLSLVLKSG